MDDRLFDKKSADAWIANIENASAEVREQDIYPELRTWLTEIAASRVLDIGAGQGVCAAKVVPDHVSYVGLEPSPYLLRRARQLYEREGRQFVEGSVYEMPFALGSFDAIYSVSVWHLLSDLKCAADEVARVLRSAGHFFIVTANPEAYAGWADYTKEDGFQLHSFEALIGSFVGAGLCIDRTETYRPSDQAAGKGVHLGICGRKPA